MSMAEILELAIDQLQPDPDQPRRVFDAEAMTELKAAIRRWGQLDPIRVRSVDGLFVIVDGERRWRALRDLREQLPDDARFQSVRVFEGTDSDNDARSRKAIQLLSNSTGVDLAPAEKALVIQELQKDGGERGLSDKALQEQFGISKGQLRYLSALAKAPEFLQQLGLPRKYEVQVLKDGKPVMEAGKVKKQHQEFPALGLSLLAELITLFNKLQDFDAARFRETHGEHKPVAAKEARLLGEAAQKNGWSKTQLQKRCGAAFSRITDPVATKAIDNSAAVGSVLQKLHIQVERLLGQAGSRNSLHDVAKMLRSMLERIDEASDVPNPSTRAKEAEAQLP
jgi:ParB/RepB/Spo0J family partition protein